MFFSEEFIARVEDNPIEGLVEACEMATTKVKRNYNGSWTEEFHEFLWEISSFIQQVIEVNDLETEAYFPEPSGDVDANCTQLFQAVQNVRDEFKASAVQLKIQSYQGRYKTAFKKSFAYEFSDGDLTRIQTLINELRGCIADNVDLEEKHKQRLLSRLESMQSELHKRVSDLDKFWGLIGDAGVVVGKLGNDAKPIVDRIKELAQISWTTQSRSEGLPSNTPNPMLESDGDS